LPRLSVERTHVLGKVVVEEDPTAPRLGGRDGAELRPAAHFFRMHLEVSGQAMSGSGSTWTDVH